MILQAKAPATIFLLLVLMYFSNLTFSQKSVFDSYIFPEHIPAKYNFDPKVEYERIISEKEINPEFNKNDYEFYAEIMSFGKYEKFRFGKTYFNWDEFEEYLNNILNKILPEEHKNKGIHVYVSRDPFWNAYAIHDESIFINSGLFADAINEASIAVILGHELAHYINKDVKNNFFLYSNVKKDKNSDEALLGYTNEERKMEHIADSLGFVLASAAGYDTRFSINNFYQFYIDEKIDESGKPELKNVGSKKNNSTLKDLLKSHPKIKDRITFARDFCKKNPQNEHKNFLVNEPLFESLQKKAKFETLRLLLNENETYNCAKNAITYYMLNPEEDGYIYYILESIRRKLYVRPDYSDRGFLTEYLRKFFSKEQGILCKPEFLIFDSLKLNLVKAPELIDTANIPFNTYSEAFDYFSAIAIKRNISECYLTLALHNINNDSLRTIYLNKYLESKEPYYKNFASALVSDKLYSELQNNNKEIIVCNDINYYVRTRKRYYSRILYSYYKNQNYYNSISNFFSSKFSNKTFYTWQTLGDYNFRYIINYYNSFNNAIYFTKFKQVEEKKENVEVFYFDNPEPEKKEVKYKMDIFIYNPDIWNFFQLEKIKSIEYLSTESEDDRTAIKDVILTTACCYPLFTFRRCANRFSYKTLAYRFGIDTKKAEFTSIYRRHKLTKAGYKNSIKKTLKVLDS